VAGSTSKTPPAKDEADELFESLTDTAKEVSEDDFDDLLDSVEEDDSEGWVPTEHGEGISGLVIKVGETRSDYAKPGDNPMVPTVTIQTKDGTKYRVIGYSSVLKRELLDADAELGDRMAVKFFGEKIARTGPYAGKPYRHFGVAVRHVEK